MQQYSSLPEPISVVGATCPLGKHLVDTLLAHGYPVLGLCRSPEKSPLHWGKDFAFHSIRFNLHEPLSLARLLETSARIIWLAQSSEISGDDKGQDPNVNALSALCAHPGTLSRKIVLISSGGSVYGPPGSLPVHEESQCVPLSVYGKSKKRLEDTLHEACIRTKTLSGVVLRPGNIYGRYYLAPDAKGCIGAFARALVASEPITLVHGGGAVRDFIHVDDVVSAILAAIHYDRPFTIWNVGNGTGVQIRQILSMICQFLRRDPIGFVNVNSAATDVDKIFLSIQRIVMECSWSPKVKLQAGLKAMLSELSPETRLIASLADSVLCGK